MHLIKMTRKGQNAEEVWMLFKIQKYVFYSMILKMFRKITSELIKMLWANIQRAFYWVYYLVKNKDFSRLF